MTKATEQLVVGRCLGGFIQSCSNRIPSNFEQVPVLLVLYSTALQNTCQKSLRLILKLFAVEYLL